MKTTKLSVSWHPNAKQFVRYIGYAVGKDGNPKPKCFYLGDNEATALATAARLKGDWLALKATGATVWPLVYLDGLNAPQVAGNATMGLLANGLTADETVNGLTVAECRTAFLAELKQRLDAGQVSSSWYCGVASRLSAAFDNRLPLAIENKPIAMVGEKDLQQAVLFWASRPIRLMGNHKRTEQTRISCFYARDVIASIKMLFVWADETERWNKPRRFDKLFRVKMPRPRIEAASFTLDELTKLYAACRCNRHRLWLMLGLNCGLDRTGLATLEWSMVKGLDTDKPYVERLRHKTGVYSRHSLWMETAELLRSVEPDDRKGFVCLTAQGEPLIEDNRDAIKMGWRHLLNRCKNVSQLSYGKLRKTGAWMIKVAGGLEASEMYLAHTEMGMNKHYANRNWSKLDDALAVMRTQLLPMLADASNAVLTAA